MNRFQHSFYQISHQKPENKFEILFNEIKKQIDIYNRQYLLTLKTYIKEWQGEISSKNETYKTQKEIAEKIYVETFDGNEDDDSAHSYAMHTSGLETLEYMHFNTIEEIDNEYKNFLDLYSKSTLIALYSLNESKLNEISNIASEIFQKKIKPSHFNTRDYLNSSIQYLELVIELETDKIEKYISKLKDIQFLRNNIVHNISIFSDIKTITEISNKHKESLNFNPENQYLKISNSKFIKDFFSLLKEFYKDLFWIIDKKQNSQIIRNGLIHWLGLIDNKISIEDFKFNKFSNNEKQMHFKAITFNADIPNFECRITLKKSKEKSFDLINQTDNEKITDFFKCEKELNGYFLESIFIPFNTDAENFEIKLMVS